ncbi:hypothetical protein D3C71_1778750 [compost metagenome]
MQALALGLDGRHAVRAGSQQGQQCSTETNRAGAIVKTGECVDFFRNVAPLRSQVQHGFEVFDQPGAPGGILVQHAQPEVDTNGVIATNAAFLTVHGPTLPGFPQLPVGCQALG